MEDRKISVKSLQSIVDYLTKNYPHELVSIGYDIDTRRVTFSVMNQFNERATLKVPLASDNTGSHITLIKEEKLLK